MRIICISWSVTVLRCFVALAWRIETDHNTRGKLFQKESVMGRNIAGRMIKTKFFFDPGNILIVIYIAVMICFLLLGGLSESGAAETGYGDDIRSEKVKRGELLLTLESGRLQRAPLLSQRVNMEISGIVARVNVEQKFVNSSEQWLEATYVFPLPDESSVDHLRLRVGERVLEGVIKERSEALRIHEKAKKSGRKSTLLSQNRANIFTTRVANVGPGEEVTVIIEYQQLVHIEGNLFSLRFPMVVAPRYIPGKPLVAKEKVRFTSGGWGVDTDQVTDASAITPPVDLAGKTTIPVDFNIDLVAGFPLAHLASLYHGITSREIAEGHYNIALTGKVLADRDFVLEWRAAGENVTRAALFAEQVENGHYMLLMLMPPRAARAESVAREVIIILDISGSMAGTSIVQAKSAVSMALGSLRPMDHFNLIVFNNSCHALFDEAKSADKNYLQMARKFIDGVSAEGGTEMKSALLLALDGSHHHERIRQVVFLTDGAVGNEDALLAVIKKRLGNSRLFTVGIGSAPNSYFMTRAAAMGRGTFTYIGKESEAKEKMVELFAKLEEPVLTDVKIESSTKGVELETYPWPLPDLYQDEPLVVTLKSPYQAGTLMVSGTQFGRSWRVSVDTSIHGQRRGVATLWARKKIRTLMESLALGADEKKVRPEVLSTALAHHLVSRYTSLVAVDDRRSRPKEAQQSQAMVATHLPQGWQAQAVFGGNAQTASPAAFRVLIGLLCLFFAVFLLLWTRKSCKSV